MTHRHSFLLAIAALIPALCAQAAGSDVLTDSLALDKGMAVTPAALLQGRVAGVQVSSYDGSTNGAVSTHIRGVNALRSDSQPLWIVDGVMITSSLNDNNNAFWQYGEKSYTAPVNALSFINPYDIESIEVIKDLSATALYGSRGANGVVIVKTAMGSEDGFRINVRSNVGFSSTRADMDGVSTGVSHNHYLNMEGISGRTRYAVSGYLRKTEGIFANDNSTYGGIRASFDTRANSVLWFGMNTFLTMGEMNSVTATSWLGQPSLAQVARRYTVFRNDPVSGWKKDYDDNTRERRVTSSMYLTFNLGKYAKWDNKAGVDFLNDNRYIWYGDGLSFGAANNGAASVLGTTVFKYNALSELSYKRVFAMHHSVNLKATAEASGDWTKYNVINGTDFFSHVLRAKGVRLAGSAAEPHKYDHNYNTLGAYAGASYAYSDIAGLNLLYRADNTPRYDDSSLRDYKAGDVYFDVHNLLLRDSKAVSSLRLSAGYGEAGREQYVPYGLYGNYITGAYPTVDTSLQAFYEGLNRLESRELNIGATLGLLSDRIVLHAAYYDKKTDDRMLAYYFGEPETSHYIKFGKRQDDFSVCSRIANRGIEGSIDAVLIQNGRTRWTLSGNLAHNVNQMMRVDPMDRYGRSVGSGTVINANVVGKQVGSLYGYRRTFWRLEDITRDGVVNEFDKEIIGKPIPEWTYGVTSTLTRGRWTLEMVCSGAAGFDILNLNTLVGLGSYSYDIHDDLVESGDWFNLGRLSVSYDLDMSKVKWISGLSLNASALNLLTISPYSGLNPMINSFGGSALMHGADYGSYPLVRSFVVGVNVNF